MKFREIILVLILFSVSFSLGCTFFDKAPETIENNCSIAGASCSVIGCCSELTCCDNKACRETCCSGQLELTALESIFVGENLTFKISGLENCYNFVYVKENGTEVCRILPNQNTCTITPGLGNHKYIAEIMMENLKTASVDVAVLEIPVYCSGTLFLSAPANVTTETNITASVYGLSNCENKTYKLFANQTLICEKEVSEKCYFSLENGTWILAAEMDMNEDGTIQENEKSTKTISVIIEEEEPELELDEISISTNSAEQMHPRIHGNTIVFSDARNGEYDVYKYDLETEEESQVTSDSSRQWLPDVYENVIVWTDFRNGEPDIYSSFGQVTSDESTQDRPVIYNNWIVYQDNRNGNYDIYLYNGTENQITTDSGEQMHPAIYNKSIVYVDNRNENWDIYLWNGTEHRITTNSANQRWASIYKDYIVYQDDRNGNSDIYLYELSKSKETRITSNSANQTQPDVYEDTIVYQDDRDGNWDIYMYNITSGDETKITSNNYDQQWAKIYNNTIVYQDNRNGNWDIYATILSWE